GGAAVTGPPVAMAAPASAGGGRPVRFVVDCRAVPRGISPLIYGVAGSEDGRHLTMGATAVRWGGNPSTRYNWQLGNAWNTGADWYFRNVKSGADRAAHY